MILIPLVAMLAVDAATAGDVAPKPGAECLTCDSAYAAAPLMRVATNGPAKVHLQDQARPCIGNSACS